MQRVVNVVRMMTFLILYQSGVTVNWSCCKMWHIYRKTKQARLKLSCTEFHVIATRLIVDWYFAYCWAP